VAASLGGQPAADIGFWLEDREIMKNNLKHLEKQLAELHQDFHPPHPPGMVWTDALEQAERDGLAPGERIVEDYYLDAAGKEVIIKERISPIPPIRRRTFRMAPGILSIWTPSIAHIKLQGIVWRTQRRM
jgi:hypothetical protein